MCLLSDFTTCLAILYVGAFTFLITGLIGIPVLCSLSCAFKVGGDGFCCIRYFIFLLSMIRLHCCNVSGYPFLSGSSPLTYMAGKALPVAKLPPA